MTENYDPFSYGELDFDGQTQKTPAAKGGGADPDDILFAAPGSELNSAPAAPADEDPWKPLESAAADSPMAGGAPTPAGGAGSEGPDLGDVVEPQASKYEMPPAPAEHRKPSLAMQDMASTVVHAVPRPSSNRRMVPVQTRDPYHRPSGRAFIMSILVLTAGLGGGAFMALVQDTALMGGLVAALGLVGAAFSFVLLRE